MEQILELLARYDVTPRQINCMICYAIECHIFDIQKGYMPELYPPKGEELLKELHELYWSSPDFNLFKHLLK